MLDCCCRVLLNRCDSWCILKMIQYLGKINQSRRLVDTSQMLLVVQWFIPKRSHEMNQNLIKMKLKLEEVETHKLRTAVIYMSTGMQEGFAGSARYLNRNILWRIRTVIQSLKRIGLSGWSLRGIFWWKMLYVLKCCSKTLNTWRL